MGNDLASMQGSGRSSLFVPTPHRAQHKGNRMYKDEDYLRSYDCDLEAADREWQQKRAIWKRGGNVGNLPLPTLLDIAWKYPKKEKPPSFGDAIKAKRGGRPKGSKNKPKAELVATDG